MFYFVKLEKRLSPRKYGNKSIFYLPKVSLKFQIYKAIAGWLLIIASVKNVCSSQKYIFYVAKKKCSDIGNIGNKSTDTNIVILGLIYRYVEIDIGASLKISILYLLIWNLYVIGRWGSFSKISKGRRPEGLLLNDQNQAGRLIANRLFLCYYFVISCLREFLLFSKAVDVSPGMFRTNQTWFDVNGGTISKNEF